MQSSSKAREELERSSWAWVDEIADADEDPITERDLLSSYRIHFPIHKTPEWKCKKNCRSNPRCYCNLGEFRWLAAVKTENDNDKSNDDEDDEDMSLEHRVSGMPVGLKNLGNTCYVNSFLQIWFHNVPFREALYKWDPARDPVESLNETLLEAEHYRPGGKVASLQALFAMMEFTNRRAVDPNDFIAKLGLDPQVQQDAAEFSKLFISLLESSLSNQDCNEVRSIVQNQFRGEYAYVTKCCKCKRESKKPSYFYELDLALQGQKTLTNCLEDFLKQEKLEGDNQYYCEGCDSKQDATRCVRLSELPPVLNLQLNRFIFDMQTGRKKKLNSFVQFPEVLNMSEYLRESTSDKNTYYLTGVLMHVGAEANHGHYIAHIQEATSGQWYKFSDAYVEKIQGRNPKLGSESDPLSVHQNGNKRASNGQLKINKTPSKGQQGSNNAYMLVYTSSASLEEIRRRNKQESEDQPPGKKAKLKSDKNSSNGITNHKVINDEGPLPMYLKAFIEQDRRILDEELKEQMLIKENKHKERVTLHTRMKKHYEKVPCPEDGSNFEFIPMEWLSRYFSDPSNVTPIDTVSMQCVHGKLDLKRIQDVKAVNEEVANELFVEAKNNMETTKRLTKNSLCEICVRRQCRTIKLARSLIQDHKVITEQLKQALEEGEEGFWVGKNTIKKWRTYAREALQEIINQEDIQFIKKDPQNSISEVKAKLAKIGTDVIVSDDKDELVQNGDSIIMSNGHSEEFFNYDLICPHGNLCTQEIKRKLVSVPVWKTLSAYFKDPKTFPKTSEICPSCVSNDDRQKLAIERKKETALLQKNLLGDILNERNRPTWAKPTLNRVYLIPRKFVDEWRNFVRQPAINEVIKLIPNEILLCHHGGLIYPLDLDTESDYESVVYMVSEDEWSILKNQFTIDQEISVTRNKDETSDFLLSSEPPVCDECLAKRCRDEEEELLVYRNVTVYVRRLTGAERFPEKDLSDPDYDCYNGIGGHGRKNGMSNGHYHSNNSEFVRRSNRRQKVRGEKEFSVSSDMLLRDFKVKIMEAFKVAPFDQNLCYHGQYLTDSSQTLGELRVLPKSLIYLRADEPNPGASVIEPDDGWAMQHPEEGFKGTGLLEGS